MNQYWLDMALKAIETIKQGGDMGAVPKDDVASALQQIHEAAKS